MAVTLTHDNPNPSTVFYIVNNNDDYDDYDDGDDDDGDGDDNVNNLIKSTII